VVLRTSVFFLFCKSNTQFCKFTCFYYHMVLQVSYHIYLPIFYSYFFYPKRPWDCISGTKTRFDSGSVDHGMIQPITSHQKKRKGGRRYIGGTVTQDAPLRCRPWPSPQHPHESQPTIRFLPSPTRAHMSEQDDRAQRAVMWGASASICASGTVTRTLHWRS
jgi:hypothetical protein